MLWKPGITAEFQSIAFLLSRAGASDRDYACFLAIPRILTGGQTTARPSQPVQAGVRCQGNRSLAPLRMGDRRR